MGSHEQFAICMIEHQAANCPCYDAATTVETKHYEGDKLGENYLETGMELILTALYRSCPEAVQAGHLQKP
jgi:hypothetical protein